ncbi:MAG TPA: hypothetical protein DCE56_25970, partial [Cyanobacteria bacterium UBA8553]|nr:hypothetical protein [Cyanobacteria bacterium UBA8553]
SLVDGTCGAGTVGVTGTVGVSPSLIGGVGWDGTPAWLGTVGISPVGGVGTAGIVASLPGG